MPLSASLLKQLIAPVTSMAALGKIAFTVPLPEIFWQVLHQQILAISGLARRNREFPAVIKPYVETG